MIYCPVLQSQTIAFERFFPTLYLCVLQFAIIIMDELNFIMFFRFIQYNPTSLERNYKHDVLTDIDLGVPIDLILPETYISKDDSG